MNNLIVKNKKFGNLEIYVDEKGKVWFPATEVAEMLGYKNPHKAILDHCKEHGVTFREVIANTGFGDSKQKKKYIDEGNVFRLITKSHIPGAEEFESWIFDEVIPQIMKTGKYEIKTSKNKTLDQEIKLKNSRSRMANAYLKIANNPIFPNEYRQIMLTYAANELSGTPVIPLPSSEKRTFSATEIGEKLGISANKVGTLANTHGLKTDEFGKFVWDKSPYSAKQVEAFRYYENVIPMLEGILKGN